MTSTRRKAKPVKQNAVIRLDPGQRAELEAFAAANRLSMSAAARFLIQKGLREARGE